MATVEKLAETCTAADVESADAFRRVKLMTGDCEQIDAESVDVHGNFSNGLHGVGVEKDVVLRGDTANLFERLHSAKLVVRVHNGDQGGLRSDRIADGFGIDEAVRIDRKVSDFDGFAIARDGAAFFFERLTSVEHRFVFDLRGDDVFGRACGIANDTEDRVIVGFGAAAGEDDFLRASADQESDLFAGGFYSGAGALARGVDGGGVAELGGKIGKHGVEDGGFDHG